MRSSWLKFLSHLHLHIYVGIAASCAFHYTSCTYARLAARTLPQAQSLPRRSVLLLIPHSVSGFWGAYGRMGFSSPHGRSRNTCEGALGLWKEFPEIRKAVRMTVVATCLRVANMICHLMFLCHFRRIRPCLFALNTFSTFRSAGERARRNVVQLYPRRRMRSTQTKAAPVDS